MNVVMFGGGGDC